MGKSVKARQQSIINAAVPGRQEYVRLDETKYPGADNLISNLDKMEHEDEEGIVPRVVILQLHDYVKKQYPNDPAQRNKLNRMIYQMVRETRDALENLDGPADPETIVKYVYYDHREEKKFAKHYSKVDAELNRRINDLQEAKWHVTVPVKKIIQSFLDKLADNDPYHAFDDEVEKPDTYNAAKAQSDGIKGSIAAYTQAGKGLRAVDMMLQFCGNVPQLAELKGVLGNLKENALQNPAIMMTKKQVEIETLDNFNLTLSAIEVMAGLDKKRETLTPEECQAVKAMLGIEVMPKSLNYGRNEAILFDPDNPDLELDDDEYDEIEDALEELDDDKYSDLKDVLDWNKNLKANLPEHVRTKMLLTVNLGKMDRELGYLQNMAGNNLGEKPEKQQPLDENDPAVRHLIDTMIENQAEQAMLDKLTRYLEPIRPEQGLTMTAEHNPAEMTVINGHPVSHYIDKVIAQADKALNNKPKGRWTNEDKAMDAQRQKAQLAKTSYEAAMSFTAKMISGAVVAHQPVNVLEPAKGKARDRANLTGFAAEVVNVAPINTDPRDKERLGFAESIGTENPHVLSGWQRFWGFFGFYKEAISRHNQWEAIRAQQLKVLRVSQTLDRRDMEDIDIKVGDMAGKAKAYEDKLDEQQKEYIDFDLVEKGKNAGGNDININIDGDEMEDNNIHLEPVGEEDSLNESLKHTAKSKGHGM